MFLFVLELGLVILVCCLSFFLNNVFAMGFIFDVCESACHVKKEVCKTTFLFVTVFFFYHLSYLVNKMQNIILRIS